MEPEDAGLDELRRRRAGRGQGDEVAARDEQFAVQRDADRAAGARCDGHAGVGRRPGFDGTYPGALARRRHRDLVADGDPSALDAPGHDAAIVELVDRLHRQTQRQGGQPAGPARTGRALRRRSGRHTSRSPAVFVTTPSPWRAEIGITAAGLTPRPPRWRADLGIDLAEPAVVIAHPVHLVDDDHDLTHAEQMQEIAVPPRLLAHALGRVDDQQRGIGLGRAGDHVAQELGMAGRVDQDEIARRRAEADLAGVDGDALVALGLQRIQQERPARTACRAAR